jgi:Mn2+/Fe2+ NRAMP family transporter
MSLGFLAYIPAAFAAHPDWHTVGRELILPSLNTSSGYLLTAVALVGTTISPYMQFFVQSSVADKGIRTSDYKYEKLDIYSGTVFAMVIAAFVVITTGATLYPDHPVNTALDAAFALQSFAGKYASLLFGIGLFGASLLARQSYLSTLVLSAKHSASEGVSRSFKLLSFRAFYWLNYPWRFDNNDTRAPNIRTHCAADLNEAMLPILLVLSSC